MNDELIEAVQENILLWLAYMELGKITHSDASQRIEAYYLGLQEVLEIQQLTQIIPYFSDARAFLAAESSSELPPFFLCCNDTTIADELGLAKLDVNERLGKHIQFTVRKLQQG